MNDKEYREKIDKIYKMIHEKNERIKFLKEEKEKEEIICRALQKLALEKTEVNIKLGDTKPEDVVLWG